METPELVSLFLGSGKTLQRTHGQIIQTNGAAQQCYYVRSGYVKRYLISRNGTLGTHSIYGPSDFFPLTTAFLTLLDQDIYAGIEQYYYQAMTAVTLSVIEGKTLDAAAKSNPELYRELLIHCGWRLRSNTQKLENMALKDPHRRVAHLLAYYAVRFGAPSHKGGIVLTVPLKQQDIADILSLSRETVTRAISKLRDCELLSPESPLVIIDLEGLQRTYQ